MERADALEFVRLHGVVLAAASGPAPKLSEAIAGGPIKGSWWGHPEGKRIFALLEAVYASDDVLVCRLIDDKVTLVHRRLWPALAAAAPAFAASRLCRVTQRHMPNGRHQNLETAFADWLPDDAAEAARHIAFEDALAALGPWATR